LFFNQVTEQGIRLGDASSWPRSGFNSEIEVSAKPSAQFDCRHFRTNTTPIV
jgi:hypothetical protein